MDEFSDSGELYTIRNQFFTSQHHKVVSYSLDSFAHENKLRVLEFQVRSSVALSQDASQLIDQGKLIFPELTHVFDVLQAWNDLMTFGIDESTYFDDVVDAEFELQASLTALYYVKFKKDIPLAIQLLVKYTNYNTNNVKELEPYLILVQLYLIKENFSDADKIYKSFQNFPPQARDNIIYQVLESWILSIKGESDNISNSYYFYDEMLSSDFDDDPQGKFRILNVLLVMTLQLKHFPEAKELLNQIIALNYKGNENDDFIANQVTFDYLTNGGANVSALLQRLKEANAEHQLLTDLDDKNAKFDEIVNKYLAAT
ncbi:hypothetical protein C7M61_005016 [Candidozyma pseudohaemuli]|uniref:Coatomer subunit epsilon n=1 Tax=Candidozyma pseudohaemuli TaxID=418784 RepID=A0A2P7YFB9_9ASCO|nr:hypothetical protein C7M61_005016 [[Candida] pseudohaemulonii]PSK34656.1 hypothetical protein C7M61_005016 [[Candida] pseudohaemulonii]